MAAAPTYRAPMRARSIETDRYRGARFAVGGALAGIGEPLRRVPDDLEDALDLSAEGFGPKAARMLKRFAQLPDGTPIWTRTGEDEFRLGRLAGTWTYDSSAEAAETGICQVRPARWLDDEFDLVTVPRAVSLTFSRGGRNFQRINDENVEAETEALWIAAGD